MADITGRKKESFYERRVERSQGTEEKVIKTKGWGKTSTYI
jgi:hypothetical protein